TPLEFNRRFASRPCNSPPRGRNDMTTNVGERLFRNQQNQAKSNSPTGGNQWANVLEKRSLGGLRPGVWRPACSTPRAAGQGVRLMRGIPYHTIRPSLAYRGALKECGSAHLCRSLSEAQL